MRAKTTGLAGLKVALAALSLAGAAAAQVAPTQGGNVSKLGSATPGAAGQPPGQATLTGRNPLITPPAGSAAERAVTPVNAATLPSPKINLVNEAVRQTAPLTPDEILDLRRQIQARTDAMYEPINKGPLPTPVITQYKLDLSPGATPPVVRVAIAQGSVVNFVDASGAPWPIKDAENFNMKGMKVAQLDSHDLSIALLNPMAMGNVAVVLDGLASPIIFTVTPAQAQTDYRADMIVPKLRKDHGLRPLAQAADAGTPSLDAENLGGFLLKIPPKSARALTVKGLDGAMAWQISPTQMVVRTDNEVTYPAYYRKHSSGDGTSVYELPLSPQVTVLHAGEFVRFNVSGFQVDESAGAGGTSNAASSAN